MIKYCLIFLIVVLCPPAYADTPPAVSNPVIIRDPTNTTIDPQQIDHLLNHLGYPENTWGPIEKELTVFLRKIDFPHLKAEAAVAKLDPVKLKNFVSKLGGKIEEAGYIDEHPPHPLVKLLTLSFVNDDISQVIFSSPISFGEKVNSKKALVACTAISQLGSIVLNLLDLNVKVVFSPEHVFNCIPLEGDQVLFADFSNQIFQIVDLDQYYYNLGSRTRKLKDQYSLPPSRLLEINSQLVTELRSDSLQELLGFLYHYIYISDDFATTPGIFINLGNIYARNKNFDLAISFYNRSIALDPEYAESYRQRGITYGNKGQLDQALDDINKALDLFPDFSEAYHDRASIYNTRGDVDNAISDYNQAIIIDPNYEEAYFERGKVYAQKEEIDHAIAEYDKAIDLDPYYSEAYQSRAEAYFLKQEYDKAWSDVHKVQDFGDEVDADFLNKVKNASTLKTYFPCLLIVPILILLAFFIFK